MQEYTEINANIRHYSTLRFTVFTVFFVAFGGVAAVAFGLVSPRDGVHPILNLMAKFAGFLLTILFFYYECLIISVLMKNRERGTELEKHLGYRQISIRSMTAIKGSHRTAQGFYFLVALFWAVTV
ncbi:MAG: hypothetical protein AB7L70_19325, partial [Pyrinomonadaceae bacterium]